MFKINNNIGHVKTSSKTLDSIKKIKDPDIKRKKELGIILGSLPEDVEIQHMVKGKVFDLKYDGSSMCFYLNGEESSKSSERIVDYIFDEANSVKYGIEDAINSFPIVNHDLIKEMVMAEVVEFRDDVKYKGDLDSLDLGEILNKYYDNPLDELDRIYNNFFGIGEGLVVSEDRILKISEDVTHYGNYLNNGEREIGAHFMIARVKQYCHSFVMVDDDSYKCIYSYLPE